MGVRAFSKILSKEEEEIVRTFDTGATRGSKKDKYCYAGFLHPGVLRMYAAYMHKHRLQTDGTLREADNWQKGMPQEEYFDSLIRHVMDLWLIRKGEIVKDVETKEDVTVYDALCGILFNTMGMMLNILKGKG